jgi:hypothetical protein
MVRSHAVTSGNPRGEAGVRNGRRRSVRRGLGRAAWIGLVALGQAAASGGETRPASAVDPPFLESLLGRAATTAPGTYVVSAGSLAPAAAALPLVVQADAYRGAGQTTHVTIALGGEVPRGSAVRLRILSPQGTAGPSRVVAEARASTQEGRMRVVREFTLEAGEYDLQAVVGHAGAGSSDLVAALVKHRLTVPDVWRGSLAVTPLVLGESVSAAPRTPETRAFVFGPTALTPATGNGFAQSGELHVAFRVFNWKVETGKKPDLTAEYTFYQQSEKRLSFFNKIKPQKLGADTLGEAFDPRAGVVTAGMSIPLQAFPFGEFQLKVRVTDNPTGQSAEQNVRFVVMP